jgi:erythrin-vacuolar iron transport family protein
MKDFHSLSQREVLALAISLEEEDERVYADFAEGLCHDFPPSATVFDGRRAEEAGHRRRLIGLYRAKFGEQIPLIRRQDVNGFVQRKPVWLVRPLGLEAVRQQASAIEVETRRFYERAGRSDSESPGDSSGAGTSDIVAGLLTGALGGRSAARISSRRQCGRGGAW